MRAPIGRRRYGEQNVWFADMPEIILRNRSVCGPATSNTLNEETNRKKKKKKKAYCSYPFGSERPLIFLFKLLNKQLELICSHLHVSHKYIN